ncbi:MAG: hypothetical protein ACK5U4_01350, partial [Rhodospirillales bacterium]
MTEQNALCRKNFCGTAAVTPLRQVCILPRKETYGNSRRGRDRQLSRHNAAAARRQRSERRNAEPRIGGRLKLMADRHPLLVQQLQEIARDGA